MTNHYLGADSEQKVQGRSHYFRSVIFQTLTLRPCSSLPGNSSCQVKNPGSENDFFLGSICLSSVSVTDD